MQKSPVLKASGLAPIDDEPVHVFGRNLEERVVESRGDENKSDDAEGASTADEPAKQEDDVETIKKRKFDAITGEESEETVFQGDFKLFSWDSETSNWIEKGRGQLKLNDLVDPKEKRSRLIMRTGGTYRIILNVAIKHSFFKVISHTKTSIRFTDSNNVWAASGSNAGQLTDLIQDRLLDAAELAKSTPEPTTKSANEDTKSTTEDTQSSDDQDSKSEPEEVKPTTEDTKSLSEEAKSTTDSPKDSTDDNTKSSIDDAENPVASVSRAGRRCSNQSDKSDDGEIGTKKLKHSSD